MLLHGSSLQARAVGTAPPIETGSRTRRAPRRMTATAFALPLLAAILTDRVANSANANAPEAFAMLELFALSLVLAATALGLALRARTAMGSRRAALAIAWALLAAESWGLSTWLLHGTHA